MFQSTAIALLLFFQDQVPFKAKEDFEIKFDLSFRVPVRSDVNNSVDLDETLHEYQKRTGSITLPYLKLFVRILKAQPNEIKLKVFQDDKGLKLTKKIKQHVAEFKLEPGFTDDIKDRISGYKHIIQFLSSDKKIESQIVIEFDTDGNYFVNGEKRGKI